MMTFWGGCRGSWIYPWRMAQGYLREFGKRATKNRWSLAD